MHVVQKSKEVKKAATYMRPRGPQPKKNHQVEAKKKRKRGQGGGGNTNRRASSNSIWDIPLLT
jgi:hypothetical protein